MTTSPEPSPAATSDRPTTTATPGLSTGACARTASDGDSPSPTPAVDGVRPPTAPPTSTCWSSAPASPASTSSTGPARPASRCSWSRPAAASAARGTGTGTPAPGSTPRATRTATCSRRSCSTSGSGRSTSPPSPRPSATSTTWSTGSTCGATCASSPRSRPRCGTRRPGCWDVTLGAGSGDAVRARYLVAATGVLSVPYTPDVPGRELFRGEQHHTGRWPASPVDFRGKRVAVVGTSSSGVQVVPDDAGRGRVAHRLPAHRQLVHPAQQPPDHARRAGRAAGGLRAAARDPEHVDQRFRPSGQRAHGVLGLGGGAAGVLREDVVEPGLHEAHEQLRRPAVQRGGQRRVVRVHRRQDPLDRAGPGRR